MRKIMHFVIRFEIFHIINFVTCSKNGFAIFSGAVVVGSKGGLMAPGAVWALAASVWDVAASVWDVAVSMWAVAASMWAVTSSM